jgi:hypothetical protein
LLSGTVETVRAGLTWFGFGRWICIAKHLANNTLFINTARMLWWQNSRAFVTKMERKCH